MKFDLTITYADKAEEYECVETWGKLDRKNLYKNVIEYLDITRDDSGVPYEPDLEQLKTTFLQFKVTDESIINNEFNRLVKGWEFWKEFAEKMKVFDFDDESLLSDEFTLAVDENITIKVWGYECL